MILYFLLRQLRPAIPGKEAKSKEKNVSHKWDFVKEERHKQKHNSSSSSGFDSAVEASLTKWPYFPIFPISEICRMLFCQNPRLLFLLCISFAGINDGMRVCVCVSLKLQEEIEGLLFSHAVHFLRSRHELTRAKQIAECEPHNIPHTTTEPRNRHSWHSAARLNRLTIG